MRRTERWIAAALLACCALVARADLPPQLARQLARMPEPMQQLVHQREARLAAMEPSERGALLRRLAHWDGLPLADRARLREHWQAWMAMSPQQRRQVRDAATAFAALPPARQQALRDRFAALSPDQHRGWLLGPRIGAHWTQLQPLLMQVPDGERERLLATLQQMDPGELRDLAVLAQRTPPQDRAALRQGLLQTTSLNRAAWLQLRLER